MKNWWTWSCGKSIEASPFARWEITERGFECLHLLFHLLHPVREFVGQIVLFRNIIADMEQHCREEIRFIDCFFHRGPFQLPIT